MTFASSGAGMGRILAVTVDDHGTVFEGLVNVRRHDLTQPHDIAAAIRHATAGESAGIRVELSASKKMLDELAALLAAEPIELVTASLDDDSPAAPTTVLPRPPRVADSADDAGPSQPAQPAESAHPHPYTDEWGAVPVRRPGERAGVPTRPRRRFTASGAVLVAVVCVVGAACAGVIWMMADGGQEATPTSAAGSPAPSPTSSSTDPVPLQPAPETVTLEQNGLSVELPVGFTLEPDEDMWRATGPDPDFRLQIAVDPLYGVAPDALLDQVEREIEEDPELTQLERKDNRVRYHHVLPDGSEAEWTTWVDGDQQLSLGCHTRQAATTVQRTTCAMANDSARYEP